MPSERASLPRGWPAPFGAGDDDRAALVGLSGLLGMTPSALRELAWREGTARGCLEAVRRGHAGSAADRAYVDRARPDRVLTSLERLGARFIGPHEAEYPASLEDGHDPPGWLFIKGRPLDRLAPRIAMVGARNCTPLGREVAHDLAHELARAGACVVSGAARGVDAASHRGALAARGATIAVLGSGIDVEYPASSRELIRTIAAEGAIVSEYPPGVRAEPFRFPARNRIVAGLSRAVVVVEGLVDSGSKITADHALEIGRDVFAVPGPVTNPLSAAPHELIRTGATLIRGADDVLTQLGIDAELQRAAIDALDEAEARVLRAIVAPALPDTVASETGLSLVQTMTLLMQLELDGLARSAGGRYQARLAATRVLSAQLDDQA